MPEGEYEGLNKAQTKIMREYRDALEISKEYVREPFENGIRFWKMFRGHLPKEIQGTFSQMMLWLPFSMIQDDLAVSTKALFGQKNWLSFSAESIKLEPHRLAAEKWANHQLIKRQKYERTIIPTLQSSYVFGTGYRMTGHQFVKKQTPNRVLQRGIMDEPIGYVDQMEESVEGMIYGNHLNFFQVYPSPDGFMINAPDGVSDVGLGSLIVMMYPGKKWIESQPQFDKDQVAKLFKKKTDPDEDPSEEFTGELLSKDGSWNSFQQPQWIEKIKAKNKNLEHRYRIGIFFQPEKNRWSVVGEDRCLLYSGPPWLDRIPVAKYTISDPLTEFFGTGLIEITEDLIISIIMNLNMRFDYLVSQFFPTKYVPQALLDHLGGDLGVFDWEPYKTLPYEHNQLQNLEQLIVHDRTGDLTQQAFIAEDQLMGYKDMIVGSHGPSAFAGQTATVGGGLLNQNVQRAMQRAINLDQTGHQDYVDLTMRLGKKYMNEDEYMNTGAEGVPFEKINHEAITDGYGITINGARDLAHVDEVFRKQLSVAPMLIQGDLPGTMEVKRQLARAANFDNVDVIMTGEPGSAPPVPREEVQMPGGIPSVQNQAQQTANRSGPGPSGAQRANAQLALV